MPIYSVRAGMATLEPGQDGRKPIGAGRAPSKRGQDGRKRYSLFR
jgi:hypothetical protein